MSKPFWTVPKKIAFTVALAIIFSWLLGCSQPQATVNAMPADPAWFHDVNLEYFQNVYPALNDLYFGNRLEEKPSITTDLKDPEVAANSWCDNPDGTSCHIAFNLHYVKAARFADYNMLHEMCHIAVWKEHKLPTLAVNQMDEKDRQHYFHDHVWRSCMIGLDTAGAFREINIDYYREDLK